MTMAGGFAQQLKRLMRSIITGSTSTAQDARLVPTYVAEYTNPVVADVDAIIATLGSTAGIQTLTGASLDGVVGAGAIPHPRNLVIVLSSHVDWDATTAVIIGTDIDGAALSEDFAIPNAGNATVTGAKAFKTVTSVVIPAQSGTGGTATIGTGIKMGLPKLAKARAGNVNVFSEIGANSPVGVTGTFVGPATGLPYGTYAPSSAADGTKDYCVTYEIDPAGA